ncbi:response regulator, partial [Candidatus Margulisiibacteriota bacterium]
DALSLYKTTFNRLRAVFLNLSIADMKGIELLIELKSISTKPQIITMSDSSDPQLVIKSMKHGALNFIQLPFKKHSIIDALEKVTKSAQTPHKMEEDIKNQFLQKFEERMRLIKSMIEEKRKITSSITNDEILTHIQQEHILNGLSKEEKKVLFKASLEKSQTKKPSILIIEDDTQLRSFLHKILGLRYEVSSSETGKESLEILKNVSKFDVIILDIGLPDCNGVDLIPEIWKINNNVEIILLTAYKDTEYIVGSFQGKAYEYIIKPVKKDILKDAISRAIARKNNNKVFEDYGKKILASYSYQTKLNILNDFAQQRELDKKPLLMEDVYLFFPELSESGISPNTHVPKKYIETGILYLIDDLKSEIKNKTRIR